MTVGEGRGVPAEDEPRPTAGGRDEAAVGEDLEAQVGALEAGRAFVDRSELRKCLVSGADAEGWLQGLVTAGVAGLRPGELRRSLLLTPTGRIRADFHLLRLPDGFLLLQDPAQPEPVAGTLAPYVLSSDVVLEDRSASYAVFSLPRRGGAPDGLPAWRPSTLDDGVEVLVPTAAAARARETLLAALVEARAEAAEAWRVRRGIPRFPVDLDTASLPAEAGLDALLVDPTKGCFLGQEAVARVRNLGHPPRVVLHLRADGPVAVGARVVAGGREAGEVTSAAPLPGGATVVLARVRWDLRDAPLALETGLPLGLAERPASS